MAQVSIIFIESHTIGIRDRRLDLICANRRQHPKYMLILRERNIENSSKSYRIVSTYVYIWTFYHQMAAPPAFTLNVVGTNSFAVVHLLSTSMLLCNGS